MVTGSKWIKNQILIANMMDIYLSLFMVCVIRDGTWEKKTEQGANCTFSQATTWLNI